MAASAEIIVQRWVLVKRPDGPFVPAEHTRMEAETLTLSKVVEAERGSMVKDPASLATAKPKDVIVKVECLAIDAFLRTMLDEGAYHSTVPVGAVLPAMGFGVVVWAASGAKLRPGDRVTGMLGAGSYVRVDGRGLMRKLSLPRQGETASLGIFGPAGTAAYIGIHEVARRPRRGETVVVSAAAGTTGSLAAQMAKLCGARVVGIAGGPEKTGYLLEELGLDAVVDHKDGSAAVDEQLQKHCPSGVDFFFDNVGGAILDAVLNHINMYARVVICGAISQYNKGGLNTGGVHGPVNYLKLAERSAAMHGFATFNHRVGMVKAIAMLNYYYYTGKVKLREDISFGIESFPEAFAAMLTGSYIGRKIVDVSGVITIGIAKP